MNIWIVAADEREALFYDAAGTRHSACERELGATPHWADPYRLVLKITNAQVRPDRPVSAHAPMQTGGRVLQTAQGEAADSRTDRQYFARRVADEIDHARHTRRFDRLILAARPQMLGLIRNEMTDSARGCIAAEIAKDLVKFEKFDLLRYLPFRFSAHQGLRH
jgi:protein required for attachment to host cells